MTVVVTPSAPLITVICPPKTVALRIICWYRVAVVPSGSVWVCSLVMCGGSTKSAASWSVSVNAPDGAEIAERGAPGDGSADDAPAEATVVAAARAVAAEIAKNER